MADAGSGLVAVDLRWQRGALTAMTPLNIGDRPPSQLVLPRLVEPHAHLDKAFSLSLIHI